VAEKTLQFVESHVFTKRLAEPEKFEMLAAIQADLLEDPTRWPVVRGLGGACKGWVSDPREARGKSGSYRYLYLHLPKAGRIHLLLMFAKNEQGDLSPSQKKIIGRMVEAIRKEHDEKESKEIH